MTTILELLAIFTLIPIALFSWLYILWFFRKVHEYRQSQENSGKISVPSVSIQRSQSTENLRKAIDDLRQQQKVNGRAIDRSVLEHLYRNSENLDGGKQ